MASLSYFENTTLRYVMSDNDFILEVTKNPLTLA